MCGKIKTDICGDVLRIFAQTTEEEGGAGCIMGQIDLCIFKVL